MNAGRDVTDRPTSGIGDDVATTASGTSKRSRLQYIDGRSTWYRNVRDQNYVTLQLAALREGGGHDGVHWEFNVTFDGVGAKLEVWHDAFPALLRVEVLDVLHRVSGNGEGLQFTADELIDVLDGYGWHDATERERASGRPPKPDPVWNREQGKWVLP